MPGPMSVPNRSSSARVKLHPLCEVCGECHEVVKTLAQLTGEERAYLASRRRLDTGKTAKKRAKSERR